MDLTIASEDPCSLCQPLAQGDGDCLHSSGIEEENAILFPYAAYIQDSLGFWIHLDIYGVGVFVGVHGQCAVV